MICGQQGCSTLFRMICCPNWKATKKTPRCVTTYYRSRSMGLSLPHILIFAVIAILLLGGGRFSNMMGDVAKGVKNFKKGMAEEDSNELTPVTPAKPQLIEGKTAAEIIAEHERQKAAAAAVTATPTPPAPPAA